MTNTDKHQVIDASSNQVYTTRYSLLANLCCASFLVAILGTSLTAAEPEKQKPSEGTAVLEKEKPQDKSTSKAPVKLTKSLDIPPNVAKALAKKYPENKADLVAIEQQVHRVLIDVLPATVGLQVGNSAGSGVIVNSEGIILTAGHVSGNPNTKVWVILSDGRRVRGLTLGANHGIDSGMIKILEKQKGGWPFVPMAKSKEIKPGQWVIATGHPGGYRPDRTAPVRLGRVLFNNDNVICTDCTLVGGDSGGPLFNMRGELVAIHSRIGRDIRNNYHVPIETYHSTWDRLVAAELWGGGRTKSSMARVKPYLGVHLDGRHEKPQITQVDPGTPAAKAGIRAGDIVLSFDGKPVKERIDFIRRVLRKKAGANVRMELEREGITIKIALRLGGRMQPLMGGPDKLPPEEKKESPEEKSPSQNPGGKTPDMNEKAPSGKTVPPTAAQLEANLWEQYGIALDKTALRCVIARIAKDSSADNAGLQAGDVLLSWSGKDIQTAEDFFKVIPAKAGGTKIELKLLRNGRELARTLEKN